MAAAASINSLIQSTAGAVPVQNEKGETYMQKVKVQRYISGKRPEYAPASSSDEDSEAEDFVEQRPDKRHPILPNVIESIPEKMDVDEENEADDPRLQRLRAVKEDASDDSDASEKRDDARRRRHVVEPEILEVGADRAARGSDESGVSGAESDEEMDEEAIESRRNLLRQKLLSKAAEEEDEVLGKEEEGVNQMEKSEDEDDESEEDDDEYTDSEEDTGPRLKPVFVRAKDRLTMIEREKAAQKQKQAELDAKKEKEDRRREALRLVEETVRREIQEKQKVETEGHINDVCTDDENDEVEYEAWKLREMKRIKRDKEEREAIEKEAMEIERLRTMNEEERRMEQRANPKIITNKVAKGKYKFLQKFYHRGAFYLDKEDEVFKQDFSGATLEDHFDKSVLPKVMQVKKFGRSGRTKYTHLLDQDTTQFDSPWCGETLPASRAGLKQVYDKPTAKKNYKPQ